jgi:spore maturation protein CgeB
VKILYLGNNSGTSYHRYQALKRLGHDVFLVDPSWFVPPNRFVGKWIYETGAFGWEAWVAYYLMSSVLGMHFDLVWVNHGQLLGANVVKALRRKFGYVLNYFHDNLLFKRNYRKWRLFRKAIPEYNMVVVVQDNFVEYVKELGAKKVMRVFRSADDVFFKSLLLSTNDRIRWSSEICFVGTWIPERGQFIVNLLKRGIPISIWGDRWNKSREWREIRHVWRGLGVYNQNYIKIIQCSMICLGLLSTGDLHTGRSIEIPAVGGLLCGERTKEHQQMYEEGTEAVFWKDVDECANICLELLKSPKRCKEIALRGHERCKKNNYFHEPTLSRIIASAMEKK